MADLMFNPLQPKKVYIKQCHICFRIVYVLLSESSMLHAYLFRSVYPISLPFQWTDSSSNIVPQTEVAWDSPGSPVANVSKLCVYIDYMNGR